MKHNIACPLTLPSPAISPSSSARVLGVILDKQLSWQPLLQHVQSKLATQTNSLTRLTSSTRGASLRVLRLLYTAIICLANTAGCPTWWAHPLTSIFQKGVGAELQKAENKCLRAIAGVYQATPTRSLQAEMLVLLLPLHMHSRQARV